MVPNRERRTPRLKGLGRCNAGAMMPSRSVMRVHPDPDQRGRVGTSGRGDLMAFVRKCEKCGNVDDREQWSSASDAADQGAFQNWTCPSCAWTEFELVEGEAEAAKTAS
jgi:hypothetical protein